ncbi:MAG: hypothetical protein K940chlam8_00677 [Chlamydiae bacterium]|nr:hypothetical protein [Chlamydiota bacterium]
MFTQRSDDLNSQNSPLWFDLSDRSNIFMDSGKRALDFAAKGTTSSSSALNTAVALSEIGTGAALWGAYGVGTVGLWGAHLLLPDLGLS